MPINAVPTLGAGSYLSFEDPANVGVFALLDNALQFGEVGSEAGTFIQVTPISKTTHEFTADVATTPDVSIVFNEVADAAFETFLALVDAKATVNVRHNYSSGRISNSELALASRKMSSPAHGEQLKWTIGAKQSGDPVWSGA